MGPKAGDVSRKVSRRAPIFSLLFGARLLSEQGASCLSPRVTRVRGGF